MEEISVFGEDTLKDKEVEADEFGEVDPDEIEDDEDDVLVEDFGDEAEF